MKVILIPPDTRPHTLELPLQVAKIMGMKVETPPREALPNFNTPGNTATLHVWLKDTLAKFRPDALVTSLETLTLGGMIPARRVDDPEVDVLKRLSVLEWIRKEYPALKILAHGTVVRVAHGNDPYEEKEYYGTYGDQLREYSEWADKLSRGDSAAKEKIEAVKAKVPAEILTNYLATRQRNVHMHLQAIGYLTNQVLNYLALTLDDTSPYGLAAIDRRTLEAKIDSLGVWDRADIYPGADELPAVLLARFAAENSHRKPPKVAVIYNSVCGAQAELLYEDRVLGEVIKAHRRAAGLRETTVHKADLILAVNAPGKKQGEAFQQPNYEDVETAQRNLPEFVDQIQHLVSKGKPVFVLDVAYANGCDHRFMNLLLKHVCPTRILGVSGWNTAGNSIGSGIALAAAGTMFPENHTAIIEAGFTRLVDDWVYQARVRQDIAAALGHPSVFHLGKLVEKAQEEVQKRLVPEMKRIWAEYYEKPTNSTLEVRKVFLPWPRLFSVTMDIVIKEKCGDK